MTDKTHALLSASGSKRWLSCPPSARLEEKVPDKSSAAAKEGTLAHAISEFKLKAYLLNGKLPDTLPQSFSNDEYFYKSMLDYIDEYVDLAVEEINKALADDAHAYIAVEEKIDYNDWANGGFGTGDLIIVTNDYVHVMDLKFGKGIPVSALDNTQLQMYALGLISSYYCLFEFNKVQMTIVQPRNGGVSTQEKSVDELIAWGNNFVKPKAELAYAGRGKLCAGSWCKFCKVAVRCRVYADYCMELAKLEFKPPELLNDEELADALGQIDDLVHYATRLKEYALAEALAGRVFPGYKLVEGRSVRKYIDDKQIMARLAEYYDEKVYLKPKQLMSITELTKKLGKKTFDSLIGDLIDKPQGKPTLAPADDPRAEYSSPENDFDVID